MATKAQKQAFYDMIGACAAQVCRERGYGNAQLWTCMVQGAVESAYGTSSIMARANAFFGVKANSSWVKAAKYGGLVYNTKTKECYDGKTYVTITDCFRAYKSPLDSVRDYFDLIEGKRYKDSLKKNSVNDCITVIKNGGYATSPTYISTINNWYRLDKDMIEKWTVKSVAPTSTPAPVNKTTYTPGATYTLTVNLYIRDAAGGNLLTFDQITENAKKNAYSDGSGHPILKKGTRVTCQAVHNRGNQVWLKIPSGYVCAYNGAKTYIE